MRKAGKNSLLKIIVSISGIVVLSKILAFAKNIVMAVTFGASIETDLITLANLLLANTEYVITQTLATAFVPIYIGVKGETTGLEKKTFVSNAIKLFLIVASGFTLILVVGSPILAKIIAPTYESEAARILSSYIKILAPILISFLLQSLFKALLNAHERYIPGALISAIGSILMIAIIFLFSSSIGTDTIIVGLWMGSAIGVLFLGVFSKKYWSITKGNPFRDSNIIALLKLCVPLLFGYAMIFINQQIDKIIVSSMEDGTVTAMHYGNSVSQLVVTVLASFCMVMYTRLSVNSAQGERKHNASFIINTSSIAFTLLLPITVVTILCSKDIIRIVYERGAFDANATQIAAEALMGYGIMFIPFTIKNLFSRYLYSNKNTKAPVKNNIIGIVFNIGLSLALFKPLGVFGVTFASSMAELVTGILNVGASRRINPHINLRNWINNAKYWGAGCVLCVVAILTTQKYILQGIHSPYIRFPVCAVIGILFYAIPCFRLIKTIIKLGVSSPSISASQ